MSILTWSKAKQTASLSVAIVVLLSLSGCKPVEGLPSRLSQFPADLKNPKLAVSGIYADGWIGAKGSANLEQPSGDRMLLIRGEIPQIGDASFHTGIVVRVDNKEVARRALPVGSFKVSEPVDRVTGKRLVTVEFSNVQQLPGGDGRSVGARLLSMGFEPAESRTAAESSDIVRGPGLQLGTGWGAIETFKNETFRWVENDAQLSITEAKSGDVSISLLIEPGPGAGGRFLLKALDASGKQVAAVPVEARGTVKLSVPVEAGAPKEFKLHLDGGGKRTPGDARISNFRVFRIEAVPWL